MVGTALLALAFVAAEAALGRVVPEQHQGGARLTWPAAPRPVDQEQAIAPPYGLIRAARSDDAGSVDYSLNALGCRGSDRTIPNSHERGRILVLGGDSAFGVSVAEEDTFAARLERRLNASPPGSPFEVINCAVANSGTREQRAFYEEVAAAYEPSIVILAVSPRDNLSAADEARLGFSHEPRRLEGLLALTHVFLEWRHEGRRPYEYRTMADEIVALNERCRQGNARLIVIAFRNAEVDSRWNALLTTISGRMVAERIPFEDLGPTLLAASANDLTSADRVNPSSRAHELASEAIERLLGASQAQGG